MKFSFLKIKIIRLIVIALTTILVCRFIFVPFRTNGVSMEPTHVDGRFCFANRLSYLIKEPRRGDIVVVRSNEKPNPRYLLKRIIALPGETMEIKDGKTFIDGELYNEPYLEYQSNWNLGPIELDSNHYYIIGDNRSMDVSEHIHLQVHRKNIIGKVFP